MTSVGFAPEIAEAARPRDPPAAEQPPVVEAPLRAARPGFERDPMSSAPRDVPDDLQRLDRIGIMYGSGANRAESLARRSILNGEAAERFAPPPPPPGAGKIWDPTSLLTRHHFLVEKADLSREFSAQATMRDWMRLEQRWRRSKSALEAVSILQEMLAFLNTDPFITRIDAAASLEMFGKVKLRFERLVRNVWEDGPEVQFDRAKAEVCALLSAEVEERARQQREGWEPVPFGPRHEVEQLVHNLNEQWRRRQALQAAVREASQPKFRGMAVERRKPTAVQVDQRTLLASFCAP